jgi:hypothetical protein
MPALIRLAISTLVVVDRDVMAVRPAAIARIFLTLWLISPARSSCPSSACLRPVTSIKNSRHQAISNAGVVARPPRGDPSDFFLDDDAEIDFVGANNPPFGRKSRPDAVSVRSVNMS